MKKISLKLVVICTLLIVSSACKNRKEIVEEPVQVTIPSAELVMDMRVYGGSAPTGIDNVTIAGNKMSIHIRYSGGCEKHDFQLVGHKIISSSKPAQRSIKLFHNDHGDSCRELIEEVLVFEISAFAYDESEIILLMDGYEKPISYMPLR